MIDELQKLAIEMGPELAKELVELGRMALEGAHKDALVTKAERLATLAAYKSSYRVGG